MPFADDVVASAWKAANGRCQCARTTHGHSVPCGKLLVLQNRGREGVDAWEAHHKVSVDAGGGDTLSNCEILCWDCHSRTI